MRRASRGFTLVELMVTIAIIAVLAAIAVPSYANYVDRARITACSAEASVYVKTRTAGVYSEVTPLPVYVANACAAGLNLTPTASAELTGTASFTARDRSATTVLCEWASARCSPN